jgi:hypothetical protein
VSTTDQQLGISRPPSEVYAALTAIERRPDLDPTVSEIEPLHPDDLPLHETSAFRGRGGVPGQDTEFEGVVTGLQPDGFAGFLFNYANGSRLFEEWTLRPVPSGTLVTYHAELMLPSGIVGRLLDKVLVGGGFARQRERVLAQFKAALESGAPPDNATEKVY